MRMLDAKPYHSLRMPIAKTLRPPGMTQLDAHGDKRLKVAQPRRLPHAGGAFVPGLGAELKQTEVHVGYAHASPRSAGNGMLPGLSLDLSSMLSGQNGMLLAAAAGIGYLLFRRK
jgi:hypothetical protein